MAIATNTSTTYSSVAIREQLSDVIYNIAPLDTPFLNGCSKETADNLKRSGAFMPGIRPGHQTAQYIDKVLTRLTFWGGLYIMLVCLLPEFMILYYRVPFYFGGTSLLIIVVVTMDFMAQMQALMMSKQYEGLLQKANLKGYGKSGQLK